MEKIETDYQQRNRKILCKLFNSFNLDTAPLKTRVNSKYQSKGPIYILHLLAFVEIRHHVFFSPRMLRHIRKLFYVSRR